MSQRPPVTLTLGACYLGDDRCRFRVWAPRAQAVALHLLTPAERLVPLSATEHGYFEALVEGVPPGSRYVYRLDGGQDLPDPASRWQPEGVHGPSAVDDPGSFAWTDQGWSTRPLRDSILYELHVGTFTEAGTFAAVAERLDYLRELGVDTIELMPVSQFPGGRNWGYDGVFPFAPQDSYGGPAGLRALVDACHRGGFAVVLDVVYNHLGPEGNYLGRFGDYFTDHYKTPWGDAINFDGPDSDEVRRYFIESALHWLEEFHIDGFRLDAIHAIVDQSAEPFLRELATNVHRRAEELGRRAWLIAESDLNNPIVVLPEAVNGFGLDAQWADDFHHALEFQLLGQSSPYAADFGSFRNLLSALRRAYVYTGQYCPRRRKRFGAPPDQAAAEQFVVFIQNHDQVGNRAHGERLGHLVELPERKLATGLLLLSPFVPLLFMGEEYGEPAPFLYFTSHQDQALVEAVRQGRRAEFADYGWQGEPADPQAEETFRQSRVRPEQRAEGEHRALFALYRALIRLRREIPALAELSKDRTEVTAREAERLVMLRRWSGSSEVVALAHLSGDPAELTLPVPAGRWRKLLDSEAPEFLGAGSAGPDRLDSDGVARLRLAPRALLLYGRDETGEPERPA